jgi:hypothetical protein
MKPFAHILSNASKIKIIANAYPIQDKILFHFVFPSLSE